MKRRSRLEVIYDILNAIYEKNQLKITHLMYKSNLSYKKLKEYLDTLKANNMVDVSDDNIVTLKEKGLEFIKEYYRLRQFADSFGLNE